ncbi:Uncharacterised protein [Mycobacteroides abscessus]|nr:Uncharacterised protein [Mycobacteroides abscessus]
MPLREQERRGEVVGLDALAEELAVVARLRVPEHVRRERLEQRRRRVGPPAHPVARQVHAAVAQVEHGPGGVRQVADVVQREAEVGGEVGRDALGHRPARVPDAVEQPGRRVLELGEVVVLRAHGRAQLRVRAARLLGRRGALGVQALELALERDDGLERVGGQRLAHPHGPQPERVEERAALGALQLDLERVPARRRLRREQVVEARAERARHRLELAELRLALAVLEERHLRRRAADRGAELVQRHAASGAQVPDPAADRQGVGLALERDFRMFRDSGRSRRRDSHD